MFKKKTASTLIALFFTFPVFSKDKFFLEKTGAPLRLEKNWFYTSEKNPRIKDRIPRLGNEKTNLILIPITRECGGRLDDFLADYFRHESVDYSTVAVGLILLGNPEKNTGEREIQTAEFLYQRAESILAAQEDSIKNNRIRIMEKFFFLIPRDPRHFSLYLGFYPVWQKDKWSYLPGVFLFNEKNILRRILASPRPWEIRKALWDMRGDMRGDTSGKRAEKGFLLRAMDYFLHYDIDSHRYILSLARILGAFLVIFVIVEWVFFFRRRAD